MKANASRKTAYPAVPASPPNNTEEDNTVVELHPQLVDASLLRIASVSTDQELHAPVAHARTAPPDCHFVSVSDIDSHSAYAHDLASTNRAASADNMAALHNVPSTSGGPDAPHSQHQEPAYALPQAPLKVAVHASAISNDGPPHQAFTISAGPREHKLYYLWSPKSKQPDATGPSTSYVEALDQGKQQLLKDGSSPFADVTKLQVARMATFLPVVRPKKHARHSDQSWWSWMLCQQPFRAKYTVDEEEAQDDDCHPEAPSGWRWKMMLLTCCLIAMISYVDRAAITIALIPMSIQYNWNNTIKGAIGR